MERAIIGVVLAAFLVLTGVAVWEVGYFGLFEGQMQNWGGWQVLIDLVIALCLFLVWMWKDARAAGRSPWPWIVFTLGSGSIAPLVYFLVYGIKRE